MRFRHPDGSLVHVAYCTNVHAAEDLDGVIAQLERFAAPVRAALGSRVLGVGLWLAAPVARLLCEQPDGIVRLREALDRLALEVVTLNGFPYRAFQAEVVKLAVYRPDWTQAARADYTLDLAWALAGLLPDDVQDGSVSTLPLGWRTGWGEQDTATARARLGGVAHGLEALAQQTGKRVRVGLEPEPGCIVETTEQAVRALDGLDQEWLGLCLDACHLAVQFESSAAALGALDDAGVAIVKAQASAALRAPVSDARAALLAEFVEPRFMHQTRELVGAAGFAGVDDLDEALAGGLPGEREWRVHFHVPVHLDGGRTTQPELRELLDGLVGGAAPRTRHIELETYTWDVLPGGLRAGDDAALVDGLARELGWLAGELTELGLKEVA
jgi:sugar phosphate isomerase/epimerase